jgi:hypothetical protein
MSINEEKNNLDIFLDNIVIHPLYCIKNSCEGGLEREKIPEYSVFDYVKEYLTIMLRPSLIAISAGAASFAIIVFILWLYNEKSESVSTPDSCRAPILPSSKTAFQYRLPITCLIHY